MLKSVDRGLKRHFYFQSIEEEKLGGLAKSDIRQHLCYSIWWIEAHNYTDNLNNQGLTWVLWYRPSAWFHEIKYSKSRKNEMNCRGKIGKQFDKMHDWRNVHTGEMQQKRTQENWFNRCLSRIDISPFLPLFLARQAFKWFWCKDYEAVSKLFNRYFFQLMLNRTAVYVGLK